MNKIKGNYCYKNWQLGSNYLITIRKAKYGIFNAAY